MAESAIQGSSIDGLKPLWFMIRSTTQQGLVDYLSLNKIPSQKVIGYAYDSDLGHYTALVAIK